MHTACASKLFLKHMHVVINSYTYKPYTMIMEQGSILGLEYDYVP